MAELAQLREAFAERRTDLLERWIDAVVRHTWVLRNATREIEGIKSRCESILEALDSALEISGKKPDWGSSAWRAPLQAFSFCAGWMAGADLPVTAAIALGSGLRDALEMEPDPFFEQLLPLLAEAHNAGVKQKALASHRTIIEKSQVVCFHDGLPCLFLVGDPDRQALDDAIGRTMMVSVMREAKAVVVDISGLWAPEETLPVALPIFADHRRQPPPVLFLASVTQPIANGLKEVDQPSNTRFFENFGEAMAAAKAVVEESNS